MNGTAWDKALEALGPAERIWFQVWVGCGLTGYQPTTNDAMIPILFGSGSNGKSVIMTAITRTFGGYAYTGPHTPLMPNQNKKLARLLADLRGIRLCCLEELSGGVINGYAIKKLAATPMTKATHSLMVSANKLPHLNERTYAVTRRLAVLPFRHRYVPDPKSPNERLEDPNLLRKLDTPEARAAILAWAVEGAKLYFAVGQHVPPPTPKMEAAKREWLHG